MRIRTIATFAVAVLLAPSCWAQKEENGDTQRREALKKSMSARYSQILRVKNAGKVGETRKGFVGVTKAKYGDDKVEPKRGSLTVAQLVVAENADRGKLYEVLARLSRAREKNEKKREEITAELVGRGNFERILKKAKASHWVQGRDGKWMTAAGLIAKRKKEEAKKRAKERDHEKA